MISLSNLIEFKVTTKVRDILDEAGLAYEIYSDIKANPTIENVQNGADYIVAIGGGSSMDTAKAIGIIIANPEFEDIRSTDSYSSVLSLNLLLRISPTHQIPPAADSENINATTFFKNCRLVMVRFPATNS